jgi:hypothetical protein
LIEAAQQPLDLSVDRQPQLRDRVQDQHAPAPERNDMGEPGAPQDHSTA